MELAHLGRVSGALDGLGHEPGAAKGVAVHERLRQLGKGRQLALRPLAHLTSRLPPTPERARARSAAVDLPGNPARSRPG